jgi:hypothetical protein
MFHSRLESIFNHHHALYRLSGLIDREAFANEFGKLYSEKGRPGIPIRLPVELTRLRQAFNTSGEETVRQRVEHSSLQYFLRRGVFPACNAD